MLENRINKEELKIRLQKEAFTRKTLSFYRYVNVENPIEFRETRVPLYRKWSELNCFGRIYVAREGINAQMSVPEAIISKLFLNNLIPFENWKKFR